MKHMQRQNHQQSVEKDFKALRSSWLLKKNKKLNKTFFDALVLSEMYSVILTIKV